MIRAVPCIGLKKCEIFLCTKCEVILCGHHKYGWMRHHDDGYSHLCKLCAYELKSKYEMLEKINA